MSAEQRDLELVNGYCSGSLTDAEFLELEDRLRESSQLRQQFVEYRSIESALPSALRSNANQSAEFDSVTKDNVIRHLRMEVLAMAAAIMLLVGGIAYLTGAKNQGVILSRRTADCQQWRWRDLEPTYIR